MRLRLHFLLHSRNARVSFLSDSFLLPCARLEGRYLLASVLLTARIEQASEYFSHYAFASRVRVSVRQPQIIVNCNLCGDNLKSLKYSSWNHCASDTKSVDATKWFKISAVRSFVQAFWKMNDNQALIGPWLWRSWQIGHFRHQRSVVWNPNIGNKVFQMYVTVNCD